MSISLVSGCQAPSTWTCPPTLIIDRSDTAGVPLYTAADLPGTAWATMRRPLWSRCRTLRPIAATWPCTLTMLSQSESVASDPSGMRTPRAYRPSPTAMASKPAGCSFQMLVATVICSRCRLPSELFTSRVVPVMELIRPSTKFGSGAPGSTSTGSAANAAPGASEPRAVAPTMPAPLRTAALSSRRRLIVVSICARLSDDVDQDGAHAHGQAGDGAERRGGQVDDPVAAAGGAAAGPLAAPQVGLRAAVGDGGADLQAVAAVGGVVLEAAASAGERLAAGVGVGDGEAGVGGVRPGVLAAAGVTGTAGSVAGRGARAPRVSAAEPGCLSVDSCHGGLPSGVRES